MPGTGAPLLTTDTDIGTSGAGDTGCVACGLTDNFFILEAMVLTESNNMTSSLKKITSHFAVILQLLLLTLFYINILSRIKTG